MAQKQKSFSLDMSKLKNGQLEVLVEEFLQMIYEYYGIKDKTKDSK